MREFANLKNSKERRLSIRLILSYVAVFGIAMFVGLGIG